LFPTILIFFFWRIIKGKRPTIFLRLVIYLLYLVESCRIHYRINKIVSIDCVLTIISILMILISTLIIIIRFFVVTGVDRVFTKYHWLVYLSLIFIFIVKKSLLFYIFLELRLAPISLIILGWGYQPERSVSFMFMFIYTLTACLPFLGVLIQWWDLDLLTRLPGIWGFAISISWPKTTIITIFFFFFLTLGFLVKFPLYSLHLWLPKAHVEAPVRGSIILAGALLKLGGFGWYLVIAALDRGGVSRSLRAYAGLGGVLVSILCLRQIDMKVIIAYSSVGHLRLAIMALRNKTNSGFVGCLIIMIVHGFSSPGIFYGANSIYIRSGSRSILLNPRFLRFRPLVRLRWFLLCIANIRAPPRSNLLAEMVSINSVLGSNATRAGQIAFLIFLRGAYTLILYSSSQQGQKKNVFWYTNNLTYFELIVFSLVTGLVYRVTLVLVIL